MARGAMAVGAAVVVAAAAAWFFVRTPEPAGPATDEEVAAGEAAEAQALLAGGRRPDAAPAAVGAAEIVCRLTGRVLDPDGKPVAGVAVGAEVSPVMPGFGGRIPRPGSVRNAPFASAADDSVRKAMAALDAPVVGPVALALRATTAADGSFAFDLREVGNVRVDAWPTPPFAPASGWAWVQPMQRDASLVIRLARGGALPGKVVDARGAPVAAVVRGTVAAAESSTTLVGVATDPATGAFEFPAVPDGRVTLTAVVAGRVEVSHRTRMPPDAPVVIVVPAGGTLVGQVVDGKGAPLEGVELLVRTGTLLPTGGAVGGGAARGRSGPGGAYRVEGLPAGRITSIAFGGDGVRPRTEQQHARWLGTEVRDGAETRLDLVCGRGGTVAGRVLEAGTGKPLEGAEVTLLAGWGSGGQIAFPMRATADASGRFRFETVPLGRYAVLPSSPGHYFAPAAADPRQRGRGAPVMYDGMTYFPGGGPPSSADAPIVIVSREDEVVERDVELTPGLELRGTVTGPDGAPAGGAAIQLVDPSPLFGRASAWGVAVPFAGQPVATSEADGSFVVRALAPGTYALFAAKGGLSSEPSPDARVGAAAPPAPVALALRLGATVVGRVLDADGKGVLGRTVSWQVQGAAGRGVGGQAVTADDGGFKLEGVAPGTVSVSCWGGRDAGANTVVEGLTAGEVRDGVELKLRKAVRIRGIAVDASGAPAPGQSLMIQGPVSTELQTREDGTFEIGLPQPGSYTIGQRKATEWAFEGETVSVTAPADDVRVVIVPRERNTMLVGGKVVTADGTPVSVCAVTVTAGDDNVASVEAFGGEFRLEVARKGPVSVAVDGARGPLGEQLNLTSAKVEVEKDTTDLVLTLPAGAVLHGSVVDAAGAGVPDVGLQAGSRTARTDRTGQFTLRGLAAGGPVGLAVTPPSKYLPPEKVSAMPGGEPVVIRLAAGGSVSGQIVGVEDLKSLRGWVNTDTGGGRQAQVDDEGRFTLEGLPPDGVVDLTVGVYPRNGGRGGSPYLPAVLKGVAVGTTDLQVRFELGGRVRGTIVDADGQPVSGGWIMAHSPDGSGGTNARPDAQGRFTLSPLRPGKASLTYHDDRGTVRLRGETVDVPMENVRLTLPRTRKLGGRVVGLSGGTVAWLNVMAKTATGGWDGVGNVQVGGDGAFSVDVTSDGPFRIVVNAGERYARLDGVRLSTTLEIPLSMGLSIEGAVDAASLHASGTYVMANSEEWNGGAQCEKDGSFKIVGLMPGRYKLKLYANEDWKESETTVEVEAGARGVRLR